MEQRLSKSQLNCDGEGSKDLNIFNKAANHQVQAKGLDATKTKNKSAMTATHQVFSKLEISLSVISENKTTKTEHQKNDKKLIITHKLTR